MRWIGKPTLKGGRLEIGRVWFAWRGWLPPIRDWIGTTHVFTIGPIAVFVREKCELNG